MRPSESAALFAVPQSSLGGPGRLIDRLVMLPVAGVGGAIIAILVSIFATMVRQELDSVLYPAALTFALLMAGVVVDHHAPRAWHMVVGALVVAVLACATFLFDLYVPGPLWRVTYDPGWFVRRNGTLIGAFLVVSPVLMIIAWHVFRRLRTRTLNKRWTLTFASLALLWLIPTTGYVRIVDDFIETSTANSACDATFADAFACAWRTQ